MQSRKVLTTVILGFLVVATLGFGSIMRTYTIASAQSGLFDITGSTCSQAVLTINLPGTSTTTGIFDAGNPFLRATVGGQNYDSQPATTFPTTLSVTLPAGLPNGTVINLAALSAYDGTLYFSTSYSCQNPNQAPVCTNATPSVDTLWPPNHRLVPVSVQGVTDPNGDPVTITITSIRQDERTSGLGDGDTAPDGQGVGTSTATIRAERGGNGDGRVYHISFTASDGQGGTCTGTLLVSVPHDYPGTAVDGGALYDSTH